jgi:hypothetical protein
LSISVHLDAERGVYPEGQVTRFNHLMLATQLMRD